MPCPAFACAATTYVANLGAWNRSSETVLNIVKLVPDLVHVRGELSSELVENGARDQQASEDGGRAGHDFKERLCDGLIEICVFLER